MRRRRADKRPLAALVAGVLGAVAIPAALAVPASAAGFGALRTDAASSRTQDTGPTAPVVPSGRRILNLDECAAGPVVPVGRRMLNLDECAQAAPVVPSGRRLPNLDECAAAPVVQVGVRFPNLDECAARPLVPVRRRFVT